MPRKKRYAPSALDALGTPQYPKPKQLQPYSHVGVAGPPVGPSSIEALSENLMKFNRGGIRAALGYNQAAQQTAIDNLPALKQTVTDTGIAISAAGAKLGIPQKRLDHVMGNGARLAGGEQASVDLDELFNSDAWEDTLTKYKDYDKSDEFLSAIQKFAWDSRKQRKDDDSKSITENWRQGYDNAYLQSVEKRPEVLKALADWNKRKEIKDRVANITDMRGILRDNMTKFVESDATVDEEGNPIPEKKRAAYQKKLLQASLAPVAEAYTDKAHNWPTNVPEGLLYQEDVFRNAWIPVVNGAVNDINIDVDKLQTWVDGFLNLRRPTHAMLTDDKGKPTGERSKVPTGSTSVVGGFREEAEAQLEHLYDSQAARRSRLTTQSANDAKFFGDKVLWPMMDDFANETWPQEQAEAFQKEGISRIGDINHKNFNRFIAIASTDPRFKKILNSPEASRVQEEHRLVLLDTVKHAMHKFYAESEDSSRKANEIIDTDITKKVMEDVYLRIMMPSFKPIFRKMVLNSESPRTAFESFIKGNMLDTMYLQNNPDHTIEGEKLMAIMKGWMEGHFMSGDDNYGVRWGRQKLGQIQDYYADTGQIPAGAEAELIAIRVQQYGNANSAGDSDLDSDITAMLDVIKRQQTGEAELHSSIKVEKDIVLDVFGQSAAYGAKRIGDAVGDEQRNVGGAIYYPFYEKIIAPNLAKLTQMARQPDDAATTGLPDDRDRALEINLPNKEASTKTVNWLVRAITRKKTEMVNQWQSDQADAGVTDPGEKKTAWEGGGKEKVKQDLKAFFSTRAFQDEMWKFHQGQSAQSRVEETALGEKYDKGMGEPDVDSGDSRDKAAEGSLSAGRDEQLQRVHTVLEKLSSADVRHMKPVEDETGSHENVAFQMYAGQRGDRLAALGSKIRMAADKQLVTIEQDIIQTAKDIEFKGNNPMENSEELKKAQTKLKGLKNYWADIHLQYNGTSWEKSVDDKYLPIEAVFTLGEDYPVEIKVNPKGIDPRKHQIFESWADISEMSNLYDEWELAPEDMEPERLAKLKRFAAFLKTGPLNLDLMPMENGVIHEPTRQENILRYRSEVLEPQRRIKLGIDVGDMPADVNVGIKRQLLQNFFKSDGWPKGKILPAPSGKNFMFQGKEYTPDQAGHVKNAYENNTAIATQGHNVKEGIDLVNFYKFFSGVSGPTITSEHTWEDYGGYGGHPQTVYDVRQTKMDLEGKTAEELSKNTPWKQSVATALTLAAMNTANPLGAAAKMNPWHIKGRKFVLFEGFPLTDPRQEEKTTVRRKVKGDLYTASGEKRGWESSGTFLGFPYKSFNDVETNTYRSKRWDETYHKYFQLLSGGAMKMDKDHLPLTKEYSEQEITTRSFEPNSELAEAYNMLVRMSSVEDTENPYSPYLSDFKVYPLPLPPKPWNYDTTKLTPSPALPKMDKLKDSKTKVPVSSSRGGVKPKEKKE
jgi:hypothetical protein